MPVYTIFFSIGLFAAWSIRPGSFGVTAPARRISMLALILMTGIVLLVDLIGPAHFWGYSQSPG